MKKLFAALILAVWLLIVASPVNAEIKTFEGVGEYYMSDIEPPDVAKQRAKQQALRNAQKKVGVYIKSFARATNSNPTDEDILTITQKAMTVVDTRYEKKLVNDTVLFRAEIKVTLDTDEITKWFNRSEADRKS